MFWINVEGIHVDRAIYVDVYYNETFNQTVIDSMLNTLEIFGHLITKLTIDYTDIDVDNCVRINEHLTKYVSDSVSYFIIQEFDSDNIVGLTGPFKKVDTLRLETGYLCADDFNLNEVFPAVSYIHFQSKTVWFKLLLHQLPHLKRLSICGDFFTNSSDVERRLQSNSQIEILEVKRCDRNFLKMIERSLPNLEFLDIDVLDSDSVFHGDEIRLESLKKFMVSQPWESHQMRVGVVSAPVVFGNLEMFLYWLDTEKWVEVMLQNKKLSKIFLGSPTDEVFQRIVTELPNLEILWTDYRVESIDDVKKVVRFIEMAPNLKSFAIWGLDESYVDEILSRLRDQWRILFADKQKISFKRV